MYKSLQKFRFVSYQKFLGVVLVILLVKFSTCSIVEDEGRVNSEGMWQKQRTQYRNTNGNSRFDLGGLITTMGPKTGASMLGLVVFPFLLPLTILLSGALFIISMFGGTSPIVATGRRFDSNGNVDLTPSSGRDLFEKEECLERIGCEILDKSSTILESRGAKSKILRVLKLLRKFNIFPNSLEKMDSAVRNGSSCSLLKCSLPDYFKKMWRRYGKYL